MNPTSTIIFGLIFIAIGFLIGLLISNWRAKPAGEDSEGKSSPYVRRGGVYVWRDALSQRLMIQMDGNVYRNPGELNGEQRLRLAHLVGEANAWMPPKVSQPLAVGLDPSISGSVAQPLPDNIDKSKVDLPQQSIAAQIDEILQKKLVETPLAGRGIKLVELPGQGMVVMVGLEKYSDLTLVPDEEVRAMITEAVAEWEIRASRRGDKN
jgi:hypothetical protein